MFIKKTVHRQYSLPLFLVAAMCGLMAETKFSVPGFECQGLCYTADAGWSFSFNLSQMVDGLIASEATNLQV